jgi:hypothetical protein
MFICDDKKFIFLHVPKTAGTSIHIYLKDYYGLQGNERLDPPPDLHHKKVEDILKENSNYKNYFKFCVVRNPFARLFSAYKDFRFQRGLISVDFDKFVLNEFVKNFSNDVHFIPQHNFTHVNDKLFVDKVIKYENLEEVSKCFKKIGIEFKGLSLHRESSRPNESYHAHYNDSMTRIVTDFYKKDLELFNYTF